MWTDSHCHFFDLANPVGCRAKMRQNKVELAVSCGVDESSNQKALVQQKKFPEILGAVGLHPETVLKNSSAQNISCMKWLQQHAQKAIGIGEIGLDFLYADSDSKKQNQKKWFDECLALACDVQKPVFVHARKAIDETIGALEQFELPGVLLHWFDGTPEQLKRVEQNRWMISIGPAVLSQKKLQKIAAVVDLGHLVLETDCPISFSGEPSDPSWIPSVGQKIAELRGEPVEIIAEKTSQNLRKLINVSN